jgi:hypothetical protein
MSAMFDIFTIESNGKPVLLDSAERLSEAMCRADQLSRLFPGEYFAYFERDGNVSRRTATVGEGNCMEDLIQRSNEPSVAFLA